ncbi:MAG: hypothetical protein H0T64_08185 [Pyrinomonadaceae bacterium]|jgi:hypothetical protein|nr:hypothetical protein [Pyrinomonadaceae bacterium]MDQ3173681.1 hypothetical protein [Acidobacteriota bacterium]
MSLPLHQRTSSPYGLMLAACARARPRRNDRRHPKGRGSEKYAEPKDGREENDEY